jgi:hypothetical protein
MRVRKFRLQVPAEVGIDAGPHPEYVEVQGSPSASGLAGNRHDECAAVFVAGVVTA